jgi:hypothetical protein
MSRITIPLTKYTVNRLIALGLEMREAQVSFFSTKSVPMLALCKRREQAFDRLLHALEEGAIQQPPEAFESAFFSAPEAVQEWFLEHPEFAGYTHVCPAAALPPVDKRDLAAA